jgi:hypothetical protein
MVVKCPLVWHLSTSYMYIQLNIPIPNKKDPEAANLYAFSSMKYYCGVCNVELARERSRVRILLDSAFYLEESSSQPCCNLLYYSYAFLTSSSELDHITRPHSLPVLIQ